MKWLLRNYCEDYVSHNVYYAGEKNLKKFLLLTHSIYETINFNDTNVTYKGIIINNLLLDSLAEKITEDYIGTDCKIVRIYDSDHVKFI